MDNSFWIASTKDSQKYEKLQEDKTTEICIIGGGLVGLTSAYLLTKKGFKVTILEKNNICTHASGNTTAKITSQHGLFYQYLVNSYSKDYAKKYLEANQMALLEIKEIIKQENISCDLEEQDSYVFTEDLNEVEKIKGEVEALNEIGFDAEYVTETPLPIPVKAAVKFKKQAQFHPRKYAIGLAEAIIKNNGEIYENTKVYDIEKKGDEYLVKTDEYNVKCKYVILASHYPIINFPGFYFMKMYQSTSYIIAVDTHEELFDGMYITSKQPTLSLRTVPYQDKRILLVAGSDHKTGAKIDLKNSYIELENRIKEIYPKAEILYRWNTEDCISLDKIPYIGEFSEMMPNVFVATGFKKWGMTTSKVAANIILDKIVGNTNDYEEVFTSTRLRPVKNYKELTNIVKEVTYSLVLNKFNIPDDTINAIEKEDGKIIEIDGKKVGIYKDKEGKLFAIKPVCSHLGCELSFNNLDKTWDCPCHGSRFDYTGKSIYDPSIKDLEQIPIE